MGSLTSRPVAPVASRSPDDKCELEKAILSEIRRTSSKSRMDTVIRKIESALALAKTRAMELEEGR